MQRGTFAACKTLQRFIKSLVSFSVADPSSTAGDTPGEKDMYSDPSSKTIALKSGRDFPLVEMVEIFNQW